jgi:predicted glycosyltransferase involved in capsule biosynthesis
MDQNASKITNGEIRNIEDMFLSHLLIFSEILVTWFDNVAWFTAQHKVSSVQLLNDEFTSTQSLGDAQFMGHGKITSLTREDIVRLLLKNHDDVS